MNQAKDGAINFDFSPVDPNDSDAVVFAQKLNALVDAINQNRIVKSVGIDYRRTGGGTALINRGGGDSRASSEIISPFHVYTRINPGSDPENPTYQAGVFSESCLFKSKRPSDVASITGLLSDDPPHPDDSGWFTLLKTDLIWLELHLDSDGYFATAAIASWGKASDPTFHPEKDPFQVGSLGEDGYIKFTVHTDDFGNTLFNQTHSRVVIAYSVEKDGKPELTQVTRTNFILKNMVTGPNFPALIPDETLMVRYEGPTAP